LVLGPVVERYRARNIGRYFRGDAAFAKPEVYEFLEAEGYSYAIRLPTNPILQKIVTHLLSRPIGRPPNHVWRYYASFSYRAKVWSKPRRVLAKVEWHPGELCPRVGFIVTNLSRPAERVTRCYDGRGTAEQHIKGNRSSAGEIQGHKALFFSASWTPFSQKVRCPQNRVSTTLKSP